MNKLNYYLHKNNMTGEVIYIEYDKIDGYPVTPKTNIVDAIAVNKIIFSMLGKIGYGAAERRVDAELNVFIFNEDYVSVKYFVVFGFRKIMRVFCH